MVDVFFEINGRRVSPGQIGNELEKAIFREMQKSIRKAVGAAVCPRHGKTAKIVGKGQSREKLNFEVSGCCDELIERVKEKLR